MADAAQFHDAERTANDALGAATTRMDDLANHVAYVVLNDEPFDRDELEGFVNGIALAVEDIEIAGMVLADLADERATKARKLLEARERGEPDWRVEIESPRGDVFDHVKVSAENDRWTVNAFRDGLSVSVRSTDDVMLRRALARSSCVTNPERWAKETEAKIIADLLAE